MVARKSGKNSNWTFGGVPADKAIKGFGGAVLLSSRPNQTMEALTNVLGLVRVDEEGDFIRFQSTAEIGNIIDVKKTVVPKGSIGVGTVHARLMRMTIKNGVSIYRTLVTMLHHLPIASILMQFILEKREESYMRLQRILPDLLMMNQLKQWVQS